jgi:tetratricopeptide (TPR) repeat protein
MLREQAMIAIDENRPADEVTYARQQVVTLRELVEDFPSVPTYRSELVEALFGLGEGLSEQNKHDEALQHCAEAVALAERLEKRFPEISDLALCHAMAVYAHARALTRAGKLEDGLRARRRAVELSEELVRRKPDEPFYSTKLGKYRVGLMFSLIQLNRFDEALAVGDQAFTQLAEHVRRHPEFKEPRLDFASVCINIGSIQSERKEYQRAEEVLTAGLDTLTVPGGLPDGWKPSAVKLRVLLAQAQAHQKKLAAAEQNLEAARKLDPKLPQIDTVEKLIAGLKKGGSGEPAPPAPEKK